MNKILLFSLLIQFVDLSEKEVFELINIYRWTFGHKELIWSEGLGEDNSRLITLEKFQEVDDFLKGDSCRVIKSGDFYEICIK